MQPGYGQDSDLTYRRPDYGYYWGEILYKLYPRLLAEVQSRMQTKILFIFKNIIYFQKYYLFSKILFIFKNIIYFQK